MAYDLEEQESIDQMKAWWEKWGTPITTVVCIGCLCFAGWNAWQWWQRKQATNAQAVYTELMIATNSHQEQNITSLSQGLIKDYGSTVFAPLGALDAARTQADAGKFEEAKGLLEWVVNQKSFPEYHTIARLRLATVLMAMKDPKAGLDVLRAAKPNEEEMPLVLDRLGDLYLAAGDVAQARQSWADALLKTDPRTGLGLLVETKLSALPAQK